MFLHVNGENLVLVLAGELGHSIHIYAEVKSLSKFINLSWLKINLIFIRAHSKCITFSFIG